MTDKFIKGGKEKRQSQGLLLDWTMNSLYLWRVAIPSRPH